MAVQTKSWNGIIVVSFKPIITTLAAMAIKSAISAHNIQAGNSAPKKVNDGVTCWAQPLTAISKVAMTTLADHADCLFAMFIEKFFLPMENKLVFMRNFFVVMHVRFYS